MLCYAIVIKQITITTIRSSIYIYIYRTRGVTRNQTPKIARVYSCLLFVNIIQLYGTVEGIDLDTVLL